MGKKSTKSAQGEEKKKPLIINIITKLELGGAQRVMLDTLKNLEKRKFRIGLISGSEGELVGEAKNMKNSEVHLLTVFKHPIRPLHDLLAFFAITWILIKTKPAAVHTHSSKAGIIGRWAAFFARVPVRVHSVHGWSFNDYQRSIKRNLFIFFERITAPITTYFFLESNKHTEIGVKKKLLKDGKFGLLLPGIDFTEFDRIKRKKPIKPPNPINRFKPEGYKVITMIACFKPQKAPLDFIYAASLVLEKMKKVKFILVGDGALRHLIEEEIRRSDLHGDVFLLGWRKDIAEIMEASDCIVLTSLWEGMPTVLPMAMRLEKPIVANRVDGCAELIDDGKNGLLSEPKNPQSIAGNIYKVLTDDKLREKIVGNSYGYTENFEINTTTKMQEDVYLKLIKLKSSGKI